MKKSCFALFIAVFSCYCALAQTPGAKFISANDQFISYMGRVGHNDSCAELYWTGTSISINVKAASTVKALLADEAGNNYYYVITDKDGSNAKKIKIDKQKKLYTLAAGLDGAKHHIELFKITNTDFITTRFYGFEIDRAAKLLKPDRLPERKIEFFGNSITCGHGVDVPADSTDSGAPQFFNNYLAYGAITARYFNAQYHCTSKSGIGITVSWFNETMPDIYNRMNPRDPASKWDFSVYTPDIVVVNLFQNDSWLINLPNHEQFKKRWGTIKPAPELIIKAYAAFIQSVRKEYPRANIICCLGSMDATREGSPWPGYITTAITSLHDKKIVTHFFPYQKTPGHPKRKEQQAMADDLIHFIEKQKYWK